MGRKKAVETDALDGKVEKRKACFPTFPQALGKLEASFPQFPQLLLLDINIREKAIEEFLLRANLGYRSIRFLDESTNTLSFRFSRESTGDNPRFQHSIAQTVSSCYACLCLELHRFKQQRPQ